MKFKYFLNSCRKQRIPRLVIIFFLIIGLTLQSCNTKSNRRLSSQSARSHKSKSRKQDRPKLEQDLSESSQLVSNDNSFSDDQNASSSSTRGKKTKRGKIASNQNQVTTTTTSTKSIHKTDIGNKKPCKQTIEAKSIEPDISHPGLSRGPKQRRGNVHRKNILGGENLNKQLDSQEQFKKERIKPTKQENKGKKRVIGTRKSNRILSKKDKIVSNSINNPVNNLSNTSNTKKDQKLQFKKRRIAYKQPNEDEENEEEEEKEEEVIRHSRQLKRSPKRKRSRISREFDERDGYEEQEQDDNNDTSYSPEQERNQKHPRLEASLTRSRSKKLENYLNLQKQDKLKKLREEELQKEKAERLEIISQYKSPHKLAHLIRIANTNEEKANQDEIIEKEKKKDEKLTLEEINEAQYILAQYNLGKYEVEQHEPNSALLFNEAIKWYVAAASNGHLKAQQMLIKLRNRGDYSTIDIDAVGWYKQAVLAALSPECNREEYSEEDEANYEEFNQDAKQIVEDYYERLLELTNKRNIFANQLPVDRGPMRLSDLIVMNLDIDTVPVYIEWGGNYTSRLDTRAESIFAPLFTASRSARYEDAVMTIDPSGKGKDETAYCVAKRYGNNYFILEVGGLAGGYNKNKKDRIGNSPEVLKKLVLIAKKYKVNVIIVESNNDSSFDVLMQQELEKHGKKYLILRTHHQHQNKEQRIIDFLHPLAVEHRLIIDRNALKEDFDSQPRNDLHYKFFYQLMGVVEVDGLNSSNYFDKGKLKHDDRVDVVADAIRYLKAKKETPEKVRESIEDDKKLALGGNIKKQLELGQRYKNGIGVEQDYKEACKWYTMAANSGNNIDAVFNLAQLYQYQHKMILEKEKKRTETAQSDEVEKVKERETGKGKEKEKDNDNDNEERPEGKDQDNLLEQAIDLYEQALKNGHPAAPYELGKLYYKNLINVQEGNSTSTSKAISLFKVSAHRDYPQAAYQLGKLAQEAKNNSDAIEWYKKAAQQNHVKAQLELANIYYEGKLVLTDLNTGKKYYKGPAHAGYSKAMIGLGNIYYDGKDSKKNYKKAFKWYQQAAVKEDKIAYYKLGKMYEKGKSLKRKDYHLAFQYYQMAAKLKCREAEFKLGEMYERGLVTEKDFKKAREWYEKAFSNKSEEDFTKDYLKLLFNLGVMCQQGRGGTQDINMAVELFEEAASKGHIGACRELALMYGIGNGVSQNLKKAAEYYKQVATHSTDKLKKKSFN